MACEASERAPYIDTLIELMADRDEYTRSLATDILHEFDSSVRTQLLERMTALLGHQDSGVKHSALKLLQALLPSYILTAYIGMAYAVMALH